MAEKKRGSSFLSWVYMIIPSTLDLSDTPLLSQKMGRKARGEKNFLLYDLKKFAGAGVLDGPEALRRRKPPRAGRIRPLRVTGNMVIKPPAGSSFMAWQPTLPCRVWGRMLTSAQPAAPAAPRRYLPAHRWTGWRFPAGRRIRKGSGRHRLPVDSARSYAKNCIL